MIQYIISGVSISLIAYKICQKSRQRIKCCGIVAGLSLKGKADEIVERGIKILQIRGYDSAGLASIKGEEILVHKYAQNQDLQKTCVDIVIEKLHEQHKNCNITIGQIRRATCGHISDSNAHPQLDNSGKIAIIQNGTIYNHNYLRKKLKESGGVLKSETDTEIIAVMLQNQINNGMEIMEAVSVVISKLAGKFSLVIMSLYDKESLILYKKGSPLFLGFGEDQMCISSDQIIFSESIDSFIKLNDNELIKINLYETSKRFNQERFITNTYTVVKSAPSLGFDYFYIEEIHEQPQAAQRVLEYMCNSQDGEKDILPPIEQIVQQKNDISKCEHILIFGSGSSYHAALYGASMFRESRIFQSVQCEHSSEVTQFHIYQNQYAICVSQSGETLETIHSLEMLKSNGVKTIGVINTVNSSASMLCDACIYFPCGQQASAFATKTFTSSVISLSILAHWFILYKEKELFQKIKNSQLQELKQIPKQIEICLQSTQTQIKEIAKNIYMVKEVFILGSSQGFIIAKEISIKLQQVCKINSQAFPTIEFQHGPIQMITPEIDKQKPLNTVCIIIVNDDNFLQETLEIVQLLYYKNCHIILINNCPEKVENDFCEYLITVPKNNFLPFLTFLQPMQLLTYEIAKLKKINPDRSSSIINNYQYC